MAQRRMFSRAIVKTDKFLDMSPTAQNLYFHLGIEADDDGFVSSPKAIMKIIGTPEDDMRVLFAKGFVIPFESGVVVITHWKENNYIQSDRYKPTIHQQEMKMLGCEKNVYILDTQVRLGKDRLEKNTNTATKVAGIGEVIDAFKEINPSYEQLFKNKTERSAAERLIKKYSLAGVLDMVNKLREVNAIPFMPISITPYQLEKNLGKIKAKLEQQGQTRNKGIIDIRNANIQS